MDSWARNDSYQQKGFFFLLFISFFDLEKHFQTCGSVEKMENICSCNYTNIYWNKIRLHLIYSEQNDKEPKQICNSNWGTFIIILSAFNLLFPSYVNEELGWWILRFNLHKFLIYYTCTDTILMYPCGHQWN